MVQGEPWGLHGFFSTFRLACSNLRQEQLLFETLLPILRRTSTMQYPLFMQSLQILYRRYFVDPTACTISQSAMGEALFSYIGLTVTWWKLSPSQNYSGLRTPDQRPWMLMSSSQELLYHNCFSPPRSLFCSTWSLAESTISCVWSPCPMHLK